MLRYDQDLLGERRFLARSVREFVLNARTLHFEESAEYAARHVSVAGTESSVATRDSHVRDATRIVPNAYILRAQLLGLLRSFDDHMSI